MQSCLKSLMTKFPVKELGASAERPRVRDADYTDNWVTSAVNE
jgi:hypothetical protein